MDGVYRITVSAHRLERWGRKSDLLNPDMSGKFEIILKK